MRGRVESHRREKQRDLALAYWTGAFSRASKVRPLAYYMNRLDTPAADKSRGGAALLGLLRSMQANGAPVSIKKLN